MARAGRKRKIGAQREANGRAQRVYENPRQQVAEQPHRVVVPVQFREFQEAESEFGRLMLLKKITPAQHEAGKLYAALASQYRVVKGYPPLHPQAIDLTSVRGGEGGEMASHIIKSVADRYNRAFESISGQKSQKAVAYYAVFERPIDTLDGLGLLIIGLNSLVSHFGIDRNLQISSRHQ